MQPGDAARAVLNAVKLRSEAAVIYLLYYLVGEIARGVGKFAKDDKFSCLKCGQRSE